MIPGSISVDIKFAAKTYESRFKQHSKNHDNVVIKSINNIFPFGSIPFPNQTANNAKMPGIVAA